MSRPRNLRLLRIDDRLVRQGLTKQTSTNSAADRGERPLHIDWIEVRDGGTVNIGSWDTATAFWMQFKPEMRPDLVVADVQFEDPTSPLNFGGGDYILPTGISHFKPLAAIARAIGAPIGVAVHTQDWQIWKSKIEQQDDPVLRLLGHLAAHEIGELAAILGDAPAFSALDAETKLEACWRWLRDNHESVFIDAFEKAMSDFRRRLPAAFIPPHDWAKLARWCEEMKSNPRPFGTTASLDQDLSEDAPGVSFQLSDGTPQCISLQSLFADVLTKRHKKLREFDFAKDALPARCFELRDDDRYFELDDDDYPRIGALVKECARFHDVYQSALAVLMHFSGETGEERKNLNDVQTEFGFAPSEIALALLFKHVEHCQLLYMQWKDGYANYRWDQSADRFESRIADRDAPALMSLVRSVAQVFSISRTEGFAIADLLEKLPGISEKAIQRCLNLLLAVECIEYSAGDGYCFRAAYDGAIPPTPADFTGKRAASMGVPENLTQSPTQFLATAFGYKVDDYNSTQRKLGLAFGDGSPESGRRFLETFFDGAAPPYLKTLCRQYAIQLDWQSQEAWPRAFR